MKVFAFIMSCVIFIASITPCMDAAALNQKHVVIIVKASPNHDCNNNADVCSPLCICNCCAGCSMYYFSPRLPKFVHQNYTEYSSFYFAHIKQVTIPVWQPPQLS